MTPTTKKLLSTKEASTWSGYHTDYLARLAKNGKIAATRVGRSWLIDQDSLSRFIESQQERKKELSEILSRERVQEYQSLTEVASGKVSRLRDSLGSVKSQKSRVPLAAFRSHAFALFVALLVTGAGLLSAGTGLLENETGTYAKKVFEQATSTHEALVRAVTSLDPHFAIAPRAAEVNEKIIPVAIAELPVLTYPSIAVVQSGSDISPTEHFFTENKTVAKETSLSTSSFTFSSLGTSYLEGISHAGSALTSLALTLRDGGRQLPENIFVAGNQTGGFVQSLTHAVFASYQEGVYAWVRTTPELPRTTTLALLVAGNELHTAVIGTPDRVATLYKNSTNDFVLGSFDAAESIAQNKLLLEKSVAAHSNATLTSGSIFLADVLQQSKETVSPRATAGTLDAFIPQASYAAVSEIPSKIGSVFNGPRTFIASLFAPKNTQIATVKQPILGTVYSGGEEVALYTYTAINSLFHSVWDGARSLAELFKPQTIAIIPAALFPDTPAGNEPATTTIATTPTGTTQTVIGTGNSFINKIANYYLSINGVTNAYLEQRLAEVSRAIVIQILDRRGGQGGGPVDLTNISGSTITNSTFQGSSVTTDLLTATNASTTNATTTNLVATDATIDNLTVTTGTTTLANLIVTNSTTTNGTTTNGFVANLIATNATTTNATSTNFFSTNASITNLIANLATVDDILATNATTTNLVATNATSTNLYALNGTIDNLLSTLATITGLTTTNATTTNLTVSSLAAGRVPFAGVGGLLQDSANLLFNGTELFANSLSAVNGTTTNATSTNFFSTNGNITNFLSTLATITDLTTTNATTTGSFIANGNVALGDASADTLLFNGSVGSNIIPTTNNTYDIGSPAFYWNNGFFDSLTVNNLNAANIAISGTSNSAFTINSDNASNDTEDESLIFYRGTASPNALLSWNSTLDRFEMNFPLALGTLISDNASTTNATSTNLFATNGTISNLFSTIAAITSLSSTNSTSTNATSTNLFSTNGAFTNLSADVLNLEDLIVNNSTTTNATSTNFFSTNGTISNFFSTLATITGLTTTNATTTNLTVSSLTAGRVPFVGVGGLLQDSANLLFNGTTLTANTLNLTNALAAIYGGTGQSTVATGDLLYGSATNTWSKLADIATGNVLLSGGVGVAPSWGKVGLTTAVSGVLPIANGGTATSTQTTNGVNYFDGTSITSGSQFVFDGTNVGIGTTTPFGKLNVYGGSIVQSATGGIIKINGSGVTVFTTNTSAGSGFLELANSSATTNVHIDSNGASYFNGGNVGIGTTTPSGKLHVSGTGNILSYIESTDSNAAQLILKSGSTNRRIIGQNAAGVVQSQIIFDDTGAFGFYGSTVADVRMNILSNGNVGIGSTTPSAKLVVAGQTLAQYFTATSTTQASTFPLASTTQTTVASALYNSYLTNERVPFTSGASGLLTDSDNFRFRNNNELYVQGTIKNNNVELSTDSNGVIELKGITPGVDSPHIDLADTSVTDFDWRLEQNTAANIFSIYSSANTNILTLTKTSGNVGIGSSTPNAKLSVKGNGTTTGINFQTTNSSNTPLITVLDNGNVGIGTTTPGARLHVAANTAYGSGSTYGIWAGNASAPSKKLMLGYDSSINAGVIQSTDTGVGYQNTIINPNGGNVGIGTTTPSVKFEIGDSENAVIDSIVTNSNAGTTAFASMQVRNGYTTSADGMRMLAMGTGWTTIGAFVQDAGVLDAGTNLAGGLSIVSRNASAPIRFYTGGATDANERMRIDSAGNVGIGTASPNKLLQVYGISSAYSQSLLGIQQSGSFAAMPNYAATIQTYGNRTGSNGTQHGLYVQAGFNSADTEIARFSAIGSSFADTPRVVIMSSGNVGIGSTNPLSPLSVYAGNGQLTAALTDAGVRDANIAIDSTSTSAGAGGAITFGNAQSIAAGSIGYAAIKGLLTNGSGKTIGDLAFSTRNAVADTALTERMRILANGNVGIGNSGPSYPLDVTGISRSSADIISTGYSLGGQFRAINGNFGFFIRNDGGNTYFLLTASGDQYGSFNTLRPFAINDTTGLVTSSNGQSFGGGLTNSGSTTLSGLTASRLVATDGSKVLTNTITLANVVNSISDVSGSTGTTNLVLSAGPTLTGTVTSTGNFTVNNGAADGGELVLMSSGFSNWNLDNLSGTLRMFYGGSVKTTVDTTGNFSTITGNITSSGDIYASGNYYYGDSKAMFLFNDGWLRLNPSSDFASGIYAGTTTLRTDGTLQVGSSGATLNVVSGGNLSFKTNVLFGDYTNSRVGIGTNAPQYPLEVYGATANFYPITNYTTAATAKQITIGEATNNASYRLSLGYYNDGTYRGLINATDAGGAGGSAPLMINTSGGMVRIGSATAPAYALDVTGKIKASTAFVAPNGQDGITTSCGWASGGGGMGISGGIVIGCTVSSDARLKTVIDYVDDGTILDKLATLPSIRFHWNDTALAVHPEMMYTKDTVQVGFVAQDVKKVFPDLVGMDDYGYYTLDYVHMIGPAIAGINELNIKVESIATTSDYETGSYAARFWDGLTHHLIAWFAETTNGIGDVFAKKVNTGELCVSAADGSATCITKSQLDALLAGAGAAPSGGNSGNSGGSSGGSGNGGGTTPPPDNQNVQGTAPTISLNGSAAMEIQQGDTFTDSGATANDAEDGDLTSAITVSGAVDTATAGSYTLTYSVLDSAGNYAEVSRMVIVDAPAAPSGGTDTSTPPDDTTQTPVTAPTDTPPADSSSSTGDTGSTDSGSTTPAP